jgi:signal transduction histidine kinase
MLNSRQPRLPLQAPGVPPPPSFVERRAKYRRAEDRQAHDEKVLLARALDILAGGASAEARLAGLLRLLAQTAGAERAAVLSEGIERRSAVSVDPGEDPAAAEALAAWLDVNADRSRAQRAAAGRAPISLVVTADAVDEDDALPDTPLRAEHRPVVLPVMLPAPTDAEVREPDGGPWYALLPIPSAGRVVIGFEFAEPDGADRLAERLTPQLARHAAVALALVTEQLATQRELALLRAREAERSTFVSTVAHELRTPLTGLGGYLELILGGKVDDPEVERDFLERSQVIVGSMANLVSDLLDLSRLESGGLALELEPFSVAEAISRVAGALMPIALDRELQLRTKLPPRLQSATGDRRGVEQILTNLAANALKYTPSGGAVEISGRFDGAVAILIVGDTGPGVPVDDRSRIFERFARLAGHERITGTGLGLPIARDLARRMGGDLALASVEGSGSAFVLALPGPAAVDAASLGPALVRALEAEEQELEERAVLRAISRRGSSRPSRLVDRDPPASEERDRSKGLRALEPPDSDGPGPA